MNKVENGLSVFTVDAGSMVICDFCDKDYTLDNKTEGGFLFQSKAVCPECAPRMMESIKRYNEECYIRSTCPFGVPFSMYVREYCR